MWLVVLCGMEGCACDNVHRHMLLQSSDAIVWQDDAGSCVCAAIYIYIYIYGAGMRQAAWLVWCNSGLWIVQQAK